MTVPIHDLVDPRTVAFKFVAEGTPQDGRSLSGILHHVPNVDDTHRVGRERMRRAGGRLEICG